MQTRVAGLIERCQDEVVLEGTLIINDDLNTLFVRYERWLKNSAAAKGQPLPDDQSTTVSTNGVATTSLMEVCGYSNHNVLSDHYMTSFGSHPMVVVGSATPT